MHVAWVKSDCIGNYYFYIVLYCTYKSDNVIVTLFFDHFGQNLECPFLWTNSDTETAFTQTDLL